MKINVIANNGLNDGIKMDYLDKYYYLDIDGNIKEKEFHNDIADNQILDTYKIFKSSTDAFNYFVFWNKVESLAKFIFSEENSYTLVCDPLTHAISIVQVEHEYLNFIYFSSFEKAKEFCEEAGVENIKKYLFNI